MKLEKKIVMVTGGGTGIGRALAEGFARNGAEVLLTGRRPGPLEETEAAIRSAGGRAHCLPADITAEPDVAGLFQTVEERWGRLDLLFNNAGSFRCLGPLWEVDPAEWWEDATINLKGSMFTMHYGLRLMRKRDEGLIINMNGGGATVPLPGGSGYGSSKAGLLRLTETVAEELKRVGSGVIVVAMGPGLVKTEMTRRQVESERGREWIPSTQEAFESDRDLTPEGCVQSVLQLVDQIHPGFSGRIFSKGMDFVQVAERLRREDPGPVYTLRLQG